MVSEIQKFVFLSWKIFHLFGAFTCEIFSQHSRNFRHVKLSSMSLTWPNCGRFSPCKVNSTNGCTQSFTKTCQNSTWHNTNITTSWVLFCWPVSVNVVSWMKGLFRIKCLGILFTGCLLPFFLSLGAPVKSLISNDKTEDFYEYWKREVKR